MIPAAPDKRHDRAAAPLAQTLNQKNNKWSVTMRALIGLLLLNFAFNGAQAQLATPNEAGLSYGHVHLNVTDVELHKQLWVEHFGGTVVRKGSLTAVRMPNMAVLLNANTPSGGSQESVLDHFGFKVRDIAKFLAKWRAAGLP